MTADFKGVKPVRSAEARKTTTQVTERGEDAGMAPPLLCLGPGRYQEAMTGAQRATSSSGPIATPRWAIGELIETAMRSGKTDLAPDAYERLAEITDVAGTDWALGIQARSPALISAGAEVEARHDGPR